VHQEIKKNLITADGELRTGHSECGRIDTAAGIMRPPPSFERGGTSDIMGLDGELWYGRSSR
jgi:hypothetical protein